MKTWWSCVKRLPRSSSPTFSNNRQSSSVHLGKISFGQGHKQWAHNKFHSKLSVSTAVNSSRSGRQCLCAITAWSKARLSQGLKNSLDFGGLGTSSSTGLIYFWFGFCAVCSITIVCGKAQTCSLVWTASAVQLPKLQSGFAALKDNAKFIKAFAFLS